MNDELAVATNAVRPPEKIFEFTRWSGREERVAARQVQFLPGGGVAFWTDGRLMLAVKDGNWDNMREIGEA